MSDITRSTSKHSQVDFFNTYSWWDKSCMLFRITKERCDYIQSCIERVFGKGALAQQEVLEVGCGGGLIALELAKRQALVVGIDPAPKALEVARKHLQENNLGQNTYFEQSYAETMPYADGSFSVIVCLDVLEHVADLNATIKEIKRVLAPGGIFIFDTINRTWMSRLALIWVGERFFRKNGIIPGLHYYHKFIKPGELHQMMRENNLKVQELTGFMPVLKDWRIRLGPGWFTGVSYIGYATKGR